MATAALGVDVLGRTRQHAIVEHEAAHLAHAYLRGYAVDFVKLDKWGDYGWHGDIGGVRRVTGDPDREPEDRAAIAAAGPLVDNGLDAASAAHDLRNIDLWRPDDWPEVEVWRFVAEQHAVRLARTEECRRLWHAFVVALRGVGDVGELTGDEIAAIAAGA